MSNFDPPDDRSLDELIENTRRLQRETQKKLAQINGARVDFLMRELEVGLTFAGLAQDAHLIGASGACQRRKRAAEEAFLAILRFRYDTNLTEAQKIRIENGVAELDATLKKLP